MKTSELTGTALDWAVAKCEGWVYNDRKKIKEFMRQQFNSAKHCYSVVWAKGGPIIERECITLRTNACIPGHWAAFIDFGSSNCNVKARQSGPTPLIAAMRCYVASKLGDAVDIPEELL